MTDRDLKSIKRLREGRRYEEALRECEKLLAESTVPAIDVLRERSHVFAQAGDYERALKDFDSVFDSGEGKLADYYLAGDSALCAKKFDSAVAYFRELLRREDEQNDTWFKDGGHFLLAYALMELGEYREAIRNLDVAVASNPDISMPLPIDWRMWHHEQLRGEINRRWKRG